MSAIIPAPSEDSFKAAIVKPFQPNVHKMSELNIQIENVLHTLSSVGMGINYFVHVRCNYSFVVIHEIHFHVHARGL